MLKYPVVYNALSSDEMTYTYGGATAIGAGCSALGLALGIINALQVGNIKRSLREESPDENNLSLTLQAENLYMSTPYGLFMTVVSAGLSILGIFI